MSEFKKGDRVRVTFEGTVRDTLPSNKVQVEPDTQYLTLFSSEQVEKIEPPVETFGPGDFVRAAETGQLFYLGRDGYMQVEPEPGVFWSYDSFGQREDFTSEEYERVTLVEPPL